MSFTFVGKVISSQLSFLASSLSSLVILCGLSSTGFRALVIAHLKHIFDSLHWSHSPHFSLHSLFIMLITAFFFMMTADSLLYPACHWVEFNDTNLQSNNTLQSPSTSVLLKFSQTLLHFVFHLIVYVSKLER